jgi:hypothetical protein
MNTVSESMSFQDIGRYGIRRSCLALKEIGSVSTSVVPILYHFAHVALVLVLSVRIPFLLGFYITSNVPSVIFEYI